jgi:putative SOS response-associated peptidase YedK
VNWFALTGDEPRPLVAFAGIWKRHVGPIKKDGEPVDIHVFSFMTTTPDQLVATVNHERMPVLLTTPRTQDQWLEGSQDEAFALSKPYPAEKMQLVQSGYEKWDLVVSATA